MAVDGTWHISVKIPIGGEQKGILVFKTEGDSLSGTSTSSFGTSNFSGGKVDGNHVEFTVKGKTLFGSANFKHKLDIDGDKIRGEVKAMGMTGQITGSRVS